MNERLLPRLNLSEGWVLRLALLMGQSVSLGITLSLLAITANSLFLVDFGAQRLPYVYITVAVAGSLLFYGLAALQRRWPLPRLAMTSIGLLSIFYLLSWLGITTAQMRWLSFALVVSFSVVIQVGFVFLGSQAGRLLDVRQIKRLFPQVVAGFVVGFILGAFLAPLLINALGSTENALVGLVFSSLIWLAFLYLTNRRYHSVLGKLDSGSRLRSTGSLRQLLGKRYTLMIFLYLILATMISQFSDFLVMAQAGSRYTSDASLAQFFSGIVVGINATDLLFTTLIAGLLLNRFGLRAGLFANPFVMTMLLLAMAVVGPALGLSSGLFFMLVVTTRIANITLTDGMTRTSTNAAYQALPIQERTLVQTGAEGIGGPVALGIVGVLLLIYNAIPGLGLVTIVFLSLILAVIWVVTSAAVYRGYKSSLVEILRRQTLSEGDLYLEDEATQTAILNLLRSGKAHETRLALDVLERAGHPSLDEHLIELLGNANPVIRAEVLVRIGARRVLNALPVVKEAAMGESTLLVKAAAVRTLCALMEGDIDEGIIQFLDAEQPELRLAAMAGLLRHGGIFGTLAAGQRLMALEGSTEQEKRLFLARVIGEVQVRNLYRPLLLLLQDEDLEVRRAALTAAGKVAHPALLELVTANLKDSAARSASASALVDFGPAILPEVQKALSVSSPGDVDQAVRLVRICCQVGGEEMQTFLKGQVNHPIDKIRHQVLAALQRSGYQVEADDLPAIQQSLQADISRAVHLLAVRRDLGEEQALVPLLRALDGELSQVQGRLFLLLSFEHDARTLMSAEKRLGSKNEGDRALAMEVLDITLSENQKAWVMPLVDPQMPLAQRIHQLNRKVSVPQKEREEHLKDLIANTQGVWQASWVRTCAIYAAGILALKVCQDAIESALTIPDATVHETAAWALERLG